MWGPKIDYKKCISCGKCVLYCHMGVFGLEEAESKKRSVVKNPTGCVVFCTGCQDICPAHAISHPSKKKTRDTILKMTKKEKEKKV